MLHTRARHLYAVAVAVTGLAVLPGSASAHCADSSASGLAAAPVAETLSDWTSAGECAHDLTLRSTAGARDLSVAAPADAKTGTLTQVGHEPLLSRGMHAAIAVHRNYAYVGSRTDAHAGTPHGGIMVVDVANPAAPRLLGPPFDAKPGESTRELRVWRSQNVLIDLNTNCGVGPTLHHCTQPSISNIRFYDIAGRNAAQPKLLSQFDVDTHEFFLWEDPANPKRALVFAGNASSTCGTRGGAPSCPFSVWDISKVRSGRPPVTLFSGLHGYSAGGLHSLTVSNDGRRAYWPLLTGGFAIVDTSEFAAGVRNPQPRLITTDSGRPSWPGPGAHSAVKLWGRNMAWVSDEVYGTATAAGHGCPWGWARMVDISNPQAPVVRGEYRLPENDPSTCANWNPPRTSYSAHNPTLTPNIAFSTWHSGGFQAVDVSNPRRPFKLAEFFPRPLDQVMLEDPRLSSDPDTGRHEKVVMWSYAVVKDGLIYVVDLRNGLYVLRYDGPSADEVRRIGFLDGNSNQGDALCYEPVGAPPSHCG